MTNFDWYTEIGQALQEELLGQVDAAGRNRLTLLMDHLARLPDSEAQTAVDALTKVAYDKRDGSPSEWAAICALTDSIPIRLSNALIGLSKLPISGVPTAPAARARFLRSLVNANAFDLPLVKLSSWAELTAAAPLECMDSLIKQNGLSSHADYVGSLLGAGRVRAEEVVARLRVWRHSAPSADQFVHNVATTIRHLSPSNATPILAWLTAEGFKIDAPAADPASLPLGAPRSLLDESELRAIGDIPSRWARFRRGANGGAVVH